MLLRGGRGGRSLYASGSRAKSRLFGADGHAGLAGRQRSSSDGVFPKPANSRVKPCARTMRRPLVRAVKSGSTRRTVCYLQAWYGGYTFTAEDLPWLSVEHGPRKLGKWIYLSFLGSPVALFIWYILRAWRVGGQYTGSVALLLALSASNTASCQSLNHLSDVRPDLLLKRPSYLVPVGHAVWDGMACLPVTGERRYVLFRRPV